MRTPKESKQKPAKVNAEKLLHRHMTYNIGEVFLDLPAFSFILLAPDIEMHGPTLISVIDLVQSLAADTPYKGPFPESMFQKQCAKAKKRHATIVKDVKRRVAELRRSGEDFILVWHAFGDKRPRCDHSDGYTWRNMRQELVACLQMKLAAETP